MKGKVSAQEPKGQVLHTERQRTGRVTGGRGSGSRTHKCYFDILHFILVNTRNSIFKFASTVSVLVLWLPLSPSCFRLWPLTHAPVRNLSKLFLHQVGDGPVTSSVCVLGSLSGASRLAWYISPGKVCHMAGVWNGRGGGVNESICHPKTAGARLQVASGKTLRHLMLKYSQKFWLLRDGTHF